MDEEFLIILGDWHDGLHYPTREGTPGGKEWEPRNFSLFERCSFFSFIYYDDFLIIIYIYCFFLVHSSSDFLSWLLFQTKILLPRIVVW